MDKLPTPEEAAALLSKIYDVFIQRHEAILKMARTYKVTSRPFQCPSKVVFQIRDGTSWGLSVYKIAASTGTLAVPIGAEGGWSHPDIIDFLESFEAIKESYVEDVARAYGVLRSSPLWVDHK